MVNKNEQENINGNLNDIFTIGDRCEGGIIKSFSLINGDIIVHFTEHYFQNLKNVKKIEKLFTTEDGVDIYEEDTFWRVDKNLSKPYESLPADKKYWYEHYIEIGTKHFSTKEKAQKYLDSIKPKPAFITSDGKEIFANDNYWAINSRLWTIWKSVSKSNTNLNKEVITFSNEKLANEYLFKNKPCLSLNDVASIYKTAREPRIGAHLTKDQGTLIHNLVKQRLGL